MFKRFGGETPFFSPPAAALLRNKTFFRRLRRGTFFLKHYSNMALYLHNYYAMFALTIFFWNWYFFYNVIDWLQLEANIPYNVKKMEHIWCFSRTILTKFMLIYSGNKHWDGFELSWKYSYMVGWNVWSLMSVLRVLYVTKSFGFCTRMSYL